MLTRDQFARGFRAQYGNEATEDAIERAWTRMQRREPSGMRHAANGSLPVTLPRPRTTAVRAPLPGNAPAENSVVTTPFAGTVTIGNPLIAYRRGDCLSLVLRFPPRTKKNSTTLGVKQSQAFTAYRNAIVAHVASFKDALGLPLPDRPYNLAALFYTDSRGDHADRFGLEQALADALQDAGVISDDWWFRTGDGTQVVSDHARPRVELTITPVAP